MFHPTQHRINLAVIGATALIPLPLLILFLLQGDVAGSIGAGAGLVIFGVLLFAYIRGWDYARYIVVTAAVLIIAGSLTERALSQYVHPLLFMAPALALVLTDQVWVIGASCAVYVIALARAGFGGLYAEPEMIVSYVIVVTTLLLSRLAIDSARSAAETSARETRAQAEQTAAALELAQLQAEDLARRNNEQQELLSLVATLETPAVAVSEGVLIAPIIGHVDSRRAQSLTARLLSTVNERRAQLLILDVSGVAMIDSGVAAAMDRLIQSVRLLGCDVAVTGIAPAVAAALSALQITFAGVRMAATPQQALSQFRAQPAG